MYTTSSRPCAQRHRCWAVQEVVLESGLDKFLVFAHHQKVLDAVEKVANKHKVGYTRIDGAVSDAAARVEKFQTEAACRIAILSIRAAGVGLTLTAASTVIFAEMTWVPAELQQAEDRVHRVGQASAVTCNYLLLEGSVDMHMWQTVQSKLGLTTHVVDGARAALSVRAPLGPGLHPCGWVMF